MSDDLVDRLLAKKVCIGFKLRPSTDNGHMVSAAQYGPDPLSTEAAAEITRLRAKVDKLAEVYWRLRSYAVHDDDCTFNRHPHYRGCSCGLKDALDNGEATIRVFQPVPAAPTEYAAKLARLKKDFPNGV